MFLIYSLRVYKLHTWQVIVNELSTVIWVSQMLSQPLKGVGSEIRTIVLTCYLKTTQQAVKLLLLYVGSCTFGDDASGPHVVKVVQKLRRILSQFLGHLSQFIDALLLQPYIIIIGGTDNS